MRLRAGQMDGVLSQFVDQPISPVHGHLKVALGQHKRLAGIAGPSADLVSEIVQLLLPCLVLRLVVWTDDQDVYVTGGARLCSGSGTEQPRGDRLRRISPS
jgi:hypothetical protein